MDQDRNICREYGVSSKGRLLSYNYSSWSYEVVHNGKQQLLGILSNGSSVMKRESTCLPSMVQPKSSSNGRYGLGRPITLMNNCTRIFEEYVRNRVEQLCNDKTKSQFGLRENRSTEEAIFKITDRYNSCFQNKARYITVFSDLAKAFDKTVHDKGIQDVSTLSRTTCQIESKELKLIIQSVIY
ncbi:hypothetical protein JTB14_010641 [Gonioctena quinquepunctata]|nr:hypothetical protein JTB14_010641 [Gonioctena quinquepunctata]